MDENARRALVTAYVLSRFPDAYERLGFSTMSEGHEVAGRAFGLTADAIKNRRDEFDPIHDNKRVGWYQREMRPSRRQIVEHLQALDENALLALVRPWLMGGREPQQNVTELLPPPANEDDSPEEGSTARTITGVRAEEFFIASHDVSPRPIPGTLEDCRAKAEGFDFKIVGSEGLTAFVEVKGLSGRDGTLTLTDKEWQTAGALGPRFWIALVTNVHTSPEIELFNDPAATWRPRSRLATVVQQSWTIGSAAIRSRN